MQDTPLDVCLAKQNIQDFCDEFIHENCNFTGNMIMEPIVGSIVDARHCQRTCKLFEEDLNCKYWVFESAESTEDKSTHCTLYDAFDVADCDRIIGPEAPLHSECTKCSCCDRCP